MTDRGRVGYDREWTTERGMPAGSRFRVGLTTRQGTPIRFVVQVEYYHSGQWVEVARSDHDWNGPPYRDVKLAGLHIDLYHPERGQFAKRGLSGPLPANEAMGRAARYLRANAERYVRRFEGWL